MPSFVTDTAILRTLAGFAGPEGRALSSVFVGVQCIGSPIEYGSTIAHRGGFDAWSTNGHVAMIADITQTAGMPSEASGFEPGACVALPAAQCAKLPKGRASFTIEREPGASGDARAVCTVQSLEPRTMGTSVRFSVDDAGSVPNLGRVIASQDGAWRPGIGFDAYAASRDACCPVFDVDYIAKVAAAFGAIAKVHGNRQHVDLSFSSAGTGGAHLMASRLAQCVAVVMPMRGDHYMPTAYVRPGAWDALASQAAAGSEG